ncbi:hypothetical protein SASPL_105429 [Salvia splendens]|uniref:Uncharacterized protein n=1 Tax=Salvia splendens TaxID=180675 RepID=A0A8X9A9B0_SALSN|nr:hypothetical protein SASPL_105429 [Salvia splendens]
MYTEPVTCPLPQTTAAAPADVHHDPSRSSLPVVGAIPPPPATISLSCDSNFGYDSMELIVVDNDEEENDVIHSSVDVSGPIYGSKDDIDDPCNVVFTCREPIHVVEHNRNGASWLDDAHSAASYMRLPGDSGRFTASDVQIFRLPSARSPPRSVPERRAVSASVNRHLINS